MTITTAWLIALLLQWTGGDVCTEVIVIDPPVALPPVVQMLGKQTADKHEKTTSRVLVGDRLYEVETQETTRYHGRSTEGVPIAFQVFIDGQHVPSSPNLDVPLRSRPAWCSLPTGTPLHP